MLAAKVLLPSIIMQLYTFEEFSSFGCVFFFFVTLMLLCCFATGVEWESGGSSGDCLLQTVCRCSLAALLKHTGLQNEACWQDRSVTEILYLLKYILSYYLLLLGL